MAIGVTGSGEEDLTGMISFEDNRKYITPQEFLRIEKKQEEAISKARKAICEAREKADKCNPPIHKRPAVPSDIIDGAIIWHEREDEFGGDYWNVVEEVLNDRSSFKAYCADDGCRYGLDGAYVEVYQEASSNETKGEG